MGRGALVARPVFSAALVGVLVPLMSAEAGWEEVERDPIRVVVALDELGTAQLADGARDTNRHSLRALWAERDDFWDIRMQHDCARAIGFLRGCAFSSDLGQLESAHAVLFSAQIFPGFGRFEETLSRVAPHQSSILWNTEAVDTFRLGPQLPVLESKVDWTASYELHSDVPLLQGLPAWVKPEDFAKSSGNWQRPRPGAIAWVASNCETTTNGRTELVRELMRFTRVDSFGKCLHNQDLPADMA